MTRKVVQRIVVVLCLACTFGGFAQDQNRRPAESNEPWPIDSGVVALNVATNADQAWTMIKEMRRENPRPTVPEVKTSAIAADICREFVKRYPDHGQVPAAKKLRCEFLIRTIELGNTNRINEFEDLFHTDRTAEFTSVFPRHQIELARVRAFRAYPAGPAAVRREMEKNLRLIAHWTPEVEYEVLKLAEESDPDNARRLAQELIALPHATRPLKTRATNILEKYAAVGRPLQLKTATLDGAAFDLEQWKGKVVLLHFWAPKPSHARYHGMDPDWTGLVSARSLYEKFHDRGLEILSINMATNEKLVRQPVRPEDKIPWPHYWASTNLSSEWRAASGMASNHLTLAATSFALLDRNATLSDRNVPRSDLAERIEKLLR